MSDRNKIIKVLSLIIPIVLVIALGTFAWIIWSSSDNTELTLTVGQLAEVKFETGNDITSAKLAPVLDYNSGEITTFNVKNKSNSYYQANVTLNIVSIDTELQTEQFKYIIQESSDNISFETIIEGTFKDIIVGDNKLGNIVFEPQSKTYYKYIMYIDSNEENNTNIMGKSVVGTINVVANTVEPNIPDISNGLIPVAYNGDTWVKADETNLDKSWYNYEEKKWANAVLVKEYDFVEDITESNKSVSIDNSSIASNVYTSSNQGIDNSTSTSTLTFTTGSNSGNLYFDYSVSSENYYDKLTISINGTTVINGISGLVSDTYIYELNANTEYVITMSYTKDVSQGKNEDQAVVSNIIIPSGSSTITHATSGNYGWGVTSVYRYNLNTYNSYIISDTGVYTISGINNVSALESIGKYICVDGISTECSQVYKIKGVSGDIITSVDVYDTTAGENLRNMYKIADVGEEIPEDDVLAYYVWIPRYKYKVFNINKEIGVDSYLAATNGIDIVWESGIESTGTVSCTSYEFNITDGSLLETCSGSNGEYYTHPAFTFGDNELTGIWVGKFEISSNDTSLEAGGGNTIDLSVRIKPNVISWKNNLITNFSYVIQSMSSSDNKYGLSTTSDSHMIKNMEWGAIAYLTHSGYGRCSSDGCTETSVNSNSSYYTGGNNYISNVGQSTTANVTGIYDMSGGAYEYVMGNMSSEVGNYVYFPSVGGNNFTYTPDTEKYIDTYANGTNNNNQIAYNSARLGDATGEVVAQSNYSWNNDHGVFVYSRSPWFSRGGNYSVGLNAGVFYFNASTGSNYATYSTRACLVSGS